MKTSRQLVVPSSPVFWALNVLLQLPQSAIRKQFNLTHHQVKRLRQGYYINKGVEVALRRYLQQRVKELRAAPCWGKHVVRYRLELVRCLECTVGFTAPPPRPFGFAAPIRRYNRIEDAVEYLEDLLSEGPATKEDAKQYMRVAGYTWKMTRRAAERLDIKIDRPRWRLKK